MKNKNVLLEDIKSNRKIKLKELVGKEKEVEKIKTLIQDYDELINSIESNSAKDYKNDDVNKISDNLPKIKRERMQIDDDIINVIAEKRDGIDPLGNLQGVTTDDIFKNLNANGVECSYNTVGNKIARLVDEGLLYQVNAPQKRFRRYARVKSEESILQT